MSNHVRHNVTCAQDDCDYGRQLWSGRDSNEQLNPCAVRVPKEWFACKATNVAWHGTTSNVNQYLIHLSTSSYECMWSILNKDSGPVGYFWVSLTPFEQAITHLTHVRDTSPWMTSNGGETSWGIKASHNNGIWNGMCSTLCFIKTHSEMKSDATWKLLIWKNCNQYNMECSPRLNMLVWLC